MNSSFRYCGNVYAYAHSLQKHSSDCRIQYISHIYHSWRKIIYPLPILQCQSLSTPTDQSPFIFRTEQNGKSGAAGNSQFYLDIDIEFFLATIATKRSAYIQKMFPPLFGSFYVCFVWPYHGVFTIFQQNTSPFSICISFIIYTMKYLKINFSLV